MCDDLVTFASSPSMVVWPRLARNCGLSVSRPLSQGFFAVFEKRESELRTLEEKKHNEEVAFSKHLKQQMESISRHLPLFFV